MSIEKITAAEIGRASMEGVANRPNQRTGFGNAGMTPQELKARYSALAMLAVNKYNELIEAFGNERDEAELLSALYTHLADQYDDQKRMSLADWIRRAEELLIDAAEVEDGKFLCVKDGKIVFAESLVGPQGAPGRDGTDGEDGVSPTVEVVSVDGGYQITVTDVNGVNTFLLPRGAKGEKGETGAQGPQGPQGERGEGFKIEKVYGSVAEMDASFATDGVPEGGFVLISTGSVEDEDNAKLYVKGATAYLPQVDLSGATGIQGPQGPQGPQGIQGPQGEQGPQGDSYTLTEADKQSIVDAVVAALPVYDGEVVTV